MQHLPHWEWKATRESQACMRLFDELFAKATDYQLYQKNDWGGIHWWLSKARMLLIKKDQKGPIARTNLSRSASTIKTRVCHWNVFFNGKFTSSVDKLAVDKISYIIVMSLLQSCSPEVPVSESVWKKIMEIYLIV